MKMQINILEKNNYGFTLKGSKALGLLMDQSTSPIDLLVRESIQNSSDAVLKNKKCSRVYFNHGSFSLSDLAAKLDQIGDNLRVKFHGKPCEYLAIRDTNTIGLIGKPDDDKGPGNNLYKLVYSFLESGKEGEAGGSWGIGKSVYYRFGIGLVFYYTRTFENGQYNEKLCGAIIENEEDRDSLLRFNKQSTGIAFFGQNVKGVNGLDRSIPIYDHNSILEFLSIFNINPLSGSETGTCIIIPFFDKEQCSTHFSNDERKFWEGDFISTLKISIQRWYFPKLFNEALFEATKNRFIKAFVNGVKVELNPFFKTLQDLYMGNVEGAEVAEIKTNQGFSMPLGRFFFKKFSKEELGIQMPPENLPSPYALLDVANSSEKNDAIVFYARRPGMIITYDDSKSFTSLVTEDECYLIGVFVLNDASEISGERLGLYFKECEAANHKKWVDISTSKKLTKIPSLKTKPFRKIQNEIKNLLNERFTHEVEEEIVTANSALQRKLAEILLPPEDFGKDKEPTIKRKKKNDPKDPLKNLKKASRTTSTFNGFVNGRPSYSFQMLLKSGDQFICRLMVNTSSKKYTFVEWDELDFVLPCYIKEFSVPEFEVGKMHYNSNMHLTLDQPDHKTRVSKIDGNGNTLFQVETYETVSSKRVYEIRVKNYYKDDIRVTLDTLLEPVDETSGFTIIRNISQFSGGNK